MCIDKKRKRELEERVQRAREQEEREIEMIKRSNIKYREETVRLIKAYVERDLRQPYREKVARYAELERTVPQREALEINSLEESLTRYFMHYNFRQVKEKIIHLYIDGTGRYRSVLITYDFDRYPAIEGLDDKLFEEITKLIFGCTNVSVYRCTCIYDRRVEINDIQKSDIERWNVESREID
jgi:chorismate mutase